MLFMPVTLLHSIAQQEWLPGCHGEPDAGKDFPAWT